MSDRDLALKALHDAEAALLAVSEVSAPAGEAVVEPVAAPPPADDAHVAPVAVAVATSSPPAHAVSDAKFLDLGPTYLGVVAVNGG